MRPDLSPNCLTINGIYKEFFEKVDFEKNQQQQIGMKNCPGGRVQGDVRPLLLSCQPKMAVTSCLVYKYFRDLESIDRLCINPICRIG